MGATRTTDTAMRSAGSFAIGDIVDRRYELRRDLGRGAGGIVFEARHRYTDRNVALKLVVPDAPRLQVAELRARLLREARALALVRHPGVVEVLDAGVLDDGTPYIVMEKLEGRTLEGLLATRGKLGVDDTVAVALQLCDALAHTHKAGVVHRDLKPGNIFVVRDPEGFERIKLVDFGIAQLTASNEPKLTSIGALIGTPAYMSPEQLLAQEDVDHHSDVYALGVTLFECLAGRVPYEGTYQQVLLQVCAPDTRTPSLQAACPEAGPDLSHAIARAIARRREERYADAAEFARALHASLPECRSRTFFLGAPPAPKFGAASTHPPPDPFAQKRKVARAAYITPVKIVLPSGAIHGRSEDISEGGLLVISRERCEANVHVTVRFALPVDGRVVEARALLRWVRAAHKDDVNGARALGLEFIDAAPDVRANIAQYVRRMNEAV